jgi:hypothetical protein
LAPRLRSSRRHTCAGTQATNSACARCIIANSGYSQQVTKVQLLRGCTKNEPSVIRDVQGRSCAAGVLLMAGCEKRKPNRRREPDTEERFITCNASLICSRKNQCWTVFLTSECPCRNHDRLFGFARPRTARIAKAATASNIVAHNTALCLSDQGLSSGRPAYSALCIARPSCA